MSVVLAYERDISGYIFQNITRKKPVLTQDKISDIITAR